MRRKLGALRAPVLAAAILTAVPGAALAADRSWEQVSPPDKNGNPVGVAGPWTSWMNTNPLLVGVDGESALFSYPGSNEGAKFGMFAAFRAERSDAGWNTTPIAPDRDVRVPSSPFKEVPVYMGASADLSRVAFLAAYAFTGFPPHRRLELVDAAGAITPVSVGAGKGPRLPALLFGDITSDGGRIVFQTTDRLEPAAAALVDGAPMLYERLPEEGVTRAVGILPDGRLAEYGATLGTFPYEGPTSTEDSNSQARGAVSDDGRHIVFSPLGPGGLSSSDPRDLYVRIDGARTVPVSEPQRTSPGAPATLPTLFQSASSDGRHVFFVSNGQLTDDDDDAFSDLYRFSFNATETGGSLARISARLGDSDQLDNRVALVAASEGGQTIYFISHVALRPGTGTDGAPNLYVSHQGEVSFIGTLSPSDTLAAQPSPATAGEYTQPQARTTPDGSTLVFQSGADQTSFPAGGVAQVYRYDVGDGVSCLSCGVIGGPPRAAASLVTPRMTPIDNLTRNVSDDGRVVVFQSNDPLVPEDANGRQDVYEWRDGAVSLISGGRGPDDAVFVGTSADDAMEDVFFLTSDQLAWSDIDTAYDLYDARRGGGFPEPPPPPRECQANCQGESTPAPFFEIPATTSFDGPGNDEEKPGVRPSFVVGKVTAAKARALARTGKLVLPVRTSGRGRVSVTIAARIGRRWVPSGSAARSVARAGTVRVTVRMARRARRRLARVGRLPVRIDVRFADASAKRATVTLRASRRGKR